MLTKQILPNKEEYDDLKSLEKRAERLRKVYCEILNNLIKDIERIKADDFDDPNWAYKRAYRDGQVDGMLKAINLIGGFDDNDRRN